jgi:hypothetical protein
MCRGRLWDIIGAEMSSHDSRRSKLASLLCTIGTSKVKRTVSVDSSVVAAKDQISSDLGGEVAILDVKTGTYYGLDDVGARIWNLIHEPKNVEEIQEVLVKEYEVMPDRCQRDLLALLQRLADEDLIEVEDRISA